MKRKRSTKRPIKRRATKRRTVKRRPAKKRRVVKKRRTTKRTTKKRTTRTSKRKPVTRRRTRKLARRQKAKPTKKRRVVRKKLMPETEPQPQPFKKGEYTIDRDFEFFDELRTLILKSSPAEKVNMYQAINGLGKVKLAVMSGIFLDRENPDPLTTDILIVCDDIDKRRLRSFLRTLEAEAGKEVKFATMDKDEFMYRLGMFDRFIRVLLDGPHEVLIDRIGLEAIQLQP